MAVPMEVTHKLLDGVSLAITALTGLFHATSSVLPSGELPELLETDAERSTGVPLLSAAESKSVDIILISGYL